MGWTLNYIKVVKASWVESKGASKQGFIHLFSVFQTTHEACWSCQINPSFSTMLSVRVFLSQQLKEQVQCFFPCSYLHLECHFSTCHVELSAYSSDLNSKGDNTMILEVSFQHLVTRWVVHKVDLIWLLTLVAYFTSEMCSNRGQNFYKRYLLRWCHAVDSETMLWKWLSQYKTDRERQYPFPALLTLFLQLNDMHLYMCLIAWFLIKIYNL